MNNAKKLLVTAAFVGAVSCGLNAMAALTVEEVDRLCPPRKETAAVFKAGAYPPAARGYDEAAKMAYRYMTSLREMRALVETGKPDQKYQHNAYVSKTHAAHIEAMLDWAKLDAARALADTITRVQESSGRIPTFWMGLNRGNAGLSIARYDWLNCTAASAEALSMMQEETGKSGGSRRICHNLLGRLTRP